MFRQSPRTVRFWFTIRKSRSSVLPAKTLTRARQRRFRRGKGNRRNFKYGGEKRRERQNRSGRSDGQGSFRGRIRRTPKYHCFAKLTNTKFLSPRILQSARTSDIFTQSATARLSARLRIRILNFFVQSSKN